MTCTLLEEDRSSLRPASQAVDPLPPKLGDELCRRFPLRRVQYIVRVLTPQELSVVRDAADAFIIARIKRMTDRRLRRFDDLVPADPKEHRVYHTLQIQWLRDQEYLLGTRLGRRPTQRELVADFITHRNGARFRAYFALKFPGKVRRWVPAAGCAVSRS
jgi:hypothetical protein